MKTNPLRILALAAVVAWQGAAGSNAQQPAQPATGNGLEQFQAVPALRNAIPAAYRQPVDVQAAPEQVPQQYFPQGNVPQQGYVPQNGGMQYDGLINEGGYPANYVGQSYGAEGGYYGDSIQYDGDVYGGGDGQYCSGGCGSGCGCDDCCIYSHYPAGHCYGYTRAEVLVLTHDIQSDQPFTSRGPNGPIVLSANDLDLEYQPGIRLIAGVPLTECTMIEASYFGLHEFTASASAVDPTDFLFSVYSGFGTQPGFIVQGRNVFDFFDGSRKQSILWDSELHSAEANLLYRIPLRNCKQEAWLTAGLRYVKLAEKLQYFTESGPNDPVLLIRTSRTEVQAENDLIGVQLGGILHHQITKKLRLSLDAKAGMACNLHETRTYVTTNLFPLGSEELDDDSLALTSDAGAALSFDVNCWFSITAGYRMTYLDGMCLALENFNPVLPGTGLRVPTLEDNGSVLYHGGHLGAEIRW